MGIETVAFAAVVGGTVLWVAVRYRGVAQMLRSTQASLDEFKARMEVRRAQCNEREAKMVGGTVTLVGQPKPVPEPAQAETGDARPGTQAMEGRWLRFCLEVNPPDGLTEWWPDGLDLESPQLEQLSEAALEELERQNADTFDEQMNVMMLFTECHLEDSSLNEKPLKGRHRVYLVAYIPEALREYRIRYYNADMGEVAL